MYTTVHVHASVCVLKPADVPSNAFFFPTYVHVCRDTCTPVHTCSCKQFLSASISLQPQVQTISSQKVEEVTQQLLDSQSTMTSAILVATEKQLQSTQDMAEGVAKAAAQGAVLAALKKPQSSTTPNISYRSDFEEPPSLLPTKYVVLNIIISEHGHSCTCTLIKSAHTCTCTLIKSAHT